MTFEKRNWLASLWLNDRFGGWSLGEIVGTAAVVVHAVMYLWGML